MRRHQVYDGPPAYSAREPLGKRLGQFVGLMGALFVVVVAVIVTQRLSRDSLALMVGLSCGVMAMLPTLVLGFVVWRRAEARQQQQMQMQQRGPYGGNPPVVVVTPQALPGYGQQAMGQYGDSQSYNPWVPASGERSFKIVGEGD